MTTAIQNTTTAKLFVTTYAVGNEHGFGTGKYFNLGDYANHDSFMEAATAYAKNELGDFDPELCFPDLDTESSIIRELNDIDDAHEQIWNVLALSDDDLAMLEAYHTCVGGKIDDVNNLLKKAQNAYVGSHESDERFAYAMAEEVGHLENIPTYLANAINWSGVASNFMMDYFSNNDYYFRNY